MLKLGEFQIFPLVEGRFHLDGGAMFGIVPKFMWEKYLPSNEKNLVPLDCNVLLVKARGKNILIDSGLGDVLTEREKKIYWAFGPSYLEAGLSGLGMKPEEIDLVVLSHLHADHCCGTVKVESNKEVPRFKRARIVVQKSEWEEATHPDEQTKAGYLTHHLTALAEHKVLDLIDGDAEIIPGLKVIRTGGHTLGHQGIEIESEGKKLVYYGDIVPSAFHLKPHYVASLDLYPRETMKVKKRIIPQAIEEGWYFAFDHDIKIKIAKLKKDQDGTILAEPVAST